MTYYNQKTYKKPHLSCPLCGNGFISSLYTINRYSPHFNVDRCSVCSFIFMNPPFTEKTLNSYYDEGYFHGSSDYSYHDERDLKKYPSSVRDKRIKIIRRYVEGGNFLDVGAAFGLLLQTAAQYYTPYGIEVSPYAGSHAKEIFGSNIHIGTLEDHPFPENFFSVISMIEVLEHIDDPMDSLAECYRLLCPGGLLVLQTANMDGLQAKIYRDRYAYFMPGHCSYFTKANLTGVLKKLGFRRIKVFYPVEFGLSAKLIKSKGSFRSIKDYTAWVRIALYHLISKFHFGNFAMTSSMVLYAFK